ncbi:MAG: NfeD family protein [Opitutaceae bacterium]|nr:NfeD family protein [Opitutaceae bacterium]
MSNIILLFAVGLVCLFFEVVVPGAVLGILGGIFMLVGCGLAFAEFGAMGGAITVVVALALLGVTFYVEFVLLPKTRLGKKMFLEKSVAGVSQPPHAHPDQVIGQGGEAVTTLAPSGYVVVAGRKYEAFSQSGLVSKGTAITVTGLDNFRLIVTKS